MNWVIYYAMIGTVWGCGVAIARLLVGEFTCPPAGSPPWVWLPATILLWPLSFAHAVVSFCIGFFDLRNREGRP
jgi:hypothetical protein